MSKVAVERNNDIDSTRGFAILLMILGHCLALGRDFNNTVISIIYSFHMPLFMVLSGYVFYFSINKGNGVSKRVRTLLYPIIVFNSYWYFLSLNNINLFSFHSWVWKIFDGYWFLWSILFTSVIFASVKKFCKDSWVVHLIILIGTFFIPSHISHIASYRWLFTYPFFMIAYFLAKNKMLVFPYIKQRLILLTFWSFVFWLSLFYFWSIKDYIYLSGLNIVKPMMEVTTFEQLAINFYRILIGLLGSLVIFLVISQFNEKCKDNRLTYLLTYLGRNSLLIYCTQEIIIVYMVKPLFGLLGLNDNYIVNQFLEH